MDVSRTSSRSAAALLGGSATLIVALLVVGRPPAQESTQPALDGKVAPSSGNPSALWEQDHTPPAAVMDEGIDAAKRSASRFAMALFAGDLEGIAEASTPALAAELSRSATGGQQDLTEDAPRLVAVETAGARGGWAHLQVLVERDAARGDGHDLVVDLVSVVVVRQNGRWLVADARF